MRPGLTALGSERTVRFRVKHETLPFRRAMAPRPAYRTRVNFRGGYEQRRVSGKEPSGASGQSLWV